MGTRAIVRSPELLSGRWHFEGTSIPIAALLSDYRFGRDAALEQYRFMKLTDEEIDAALAFAFPVVRAATIQVQYAALVLRCECGEDLQATVAWPHTEPIACVCGRTWHTPVAIEQATHPAPADAN